MSRSRGSDNVNRTKKGNGAQDRPRPVYVYTEGEVTEVTYIDFLISAESTARPTDPRRRVDVKILNRKATGGQRKPYFMVDAAVKRLREAESAAKKEGRKQTWWNWPQVWVLFDRDEHEKIPQAFALAKQAGVRIAFSHPCFELWRLLHYQNYTSTFAGVCDDASARLKARPDYVGTYGATSHGLSKERAKIVVPGQVMGRYAKAKEFARKINEPHTHIDQTRWDPYTDVWEFVENGLLFTDY